MVNTARLGLGGDGEGLVSWLWLPFLYAELFRLCMRDVFFTFLIMRLMMFTDA